MWAYACLPTQARKYPGTHVTKPLATIAYYAIAPMKIALAASLADFAQSAIKGSGTQTQELSDLMHPGAVPAHPGIYASEFPDRHIHRFADS